MAMGNDQLRKSIETNLEIVVVPSFTESTGEPMMKNPKIRAGNMNAIDPETDARSRPEAEPRTERDV